jgi:hypothetical protein
VSREDFDALQQWLRQRLGRRLYVAVTGPPERTTNTTLYAEGQLQTSEAEALLIDPAPGRIQAFRVGDATLVLVEGDLSGVEFNERQTGRSADGATVIQPAWVEADFGEITVMLSDVADSQRPSE